MLIHAARVAGAPGLVDLHITGGRVEAVVPAATTCPADALDIGGRAVIPGLVDAHVHLDKALQLDLLAAEGPAGTLREAIASTAAVRSRLDGAALRARAERALARMVRHGTTAVRVHVELDEEAGLEPVLWHVAMADAWRDRIDVQLVAFPQHGLFCDPRTPDLLVASLAAGCQVVGACPYADEDPIRHIDHVFDLAVRLTRPLDLHLDFTDDPAVRFVDAVIERALSHELPGRVAVGHVTSLAAMAPHEVQERAHALAAARVAVIALPCTDLYLSGRAADRARPRGLAPLSTLVAAGVDVAVASNNLQNAFTPYGDGALLQVAWLAGLVDQAAPGDGHRALLEMVTAAPGRILGREPHGPRVGAKADLAVLDTDRVDAVVAAPAAIDATVCDGRLSWLGPALRR